MANRSRARTSKKGQQGSHTSNRCTLFLRRDFAGHQVIPRSLYGLPMNAGRTTPDESREFPRHSRADDQDAPAEPQPSESNLVFDRCAAAGGARKDQSRNSSERSPRAAAQRGPSARRPNSGTTNLAPDGFQSVLLLLLCQQGSASRRDWHVLNRS